MFARLNRDPTSSEEAISVKEKYDWKSAVIEEIKSMKEYNVQTVIDRPARSRRKAIDSKWVFKRKIDKNGEEKFKARLVIIGFKD